MFKTIEECGLTLVAHTTLVDEDKFADWLPASAARASFGKQDKTGENPEADSKLMKYLADHQHMTPFEYQHATFLIECPLFIRSQIHRHRTFSYNEISRRYTSENLEFWIPSNLRSQSKSNRQASTNEVIDLKYDPLKSIAEYALDTYNDMLANGVCREQARAVLPQSLLTRFYMGGNLRNWAHFIQLRSDSHAQQEVQVIANRIAQELQKLWPESCKALGIERSEPGIGEDGSSAGSVEDAEGQARPAV